jgi:hypothetical protein
MNVTKKNITQVHRIRFDDGTKDTFKQPKISYMLLKSIITNDITLYPRKVWEIIKANQGILIRV